MTPIERYLPPLTENGARWARFLGVLAGAAALTWVAIALRDVLTPIVAAFALAYILNPVITWLEKRGTRRLTSIIVGLTLLLLGAAVLLIAGAIQVVEFLGHLPEYVRGGREWLRETIPYLFPASPEPAAAGTATAPAKTLFAMGSDWAQKHAVAVGQFMLVYLAGLFTDVFYWGSVIVLLPMYAFFFLLHFNTMVRAIHDHLPDRYRATIERVVTTIDRSIANFFRGRLIICLLVGTLTAIGWTIVRVPYPLPLGAMAGILTLVPFMSVLALPPAMILAYASAVDGGRDWVVAISLAAAVYMTVQAIESFILSPIVESRASGLHPVTTIIALLIGNQLAGLLGMLLAIPLASTLKSLGAEYVLPELRRLSGARGDGQDDDRTAAGDCAAQRRRSSAGRAREHRTETAQRCRTAKERMTKTDSTKGRMPASDVLVNSAPHGTLPRRSRGPFLAMWIVYALWLAFLIYLAVYTVGK